MLSYYGHINVELGEIVKIELTDILPKAGRTARYSRYLYLTTDDGSVYTLKLRAENIEALMPKNIA